MRKMGRRRFLQGTLGAGALFALACGSRSNGGGTTPAPRPAAKKILILGGTGFLGPDIVESALRRGHTVTLFNRGKTNPHLFPELEKLRGDRKTGDLAALEGRKWDAVVDTSGYVPKHVKHSAGLLGPNISHYTFVSTISVYDMDEFPRGGDESAPIATIADPTVEEVTGGTYGALKALCEQAAEAAMPGRVNNIRPGLIVGPGDPTDRFTYWPVRIARGGEILAPGDGSDPVQFIDARDLGEWIVQAIDDDIVGVYNATGPAETLTMKAMLEACKRAAASDASFTWAPAKWLEERKVSAWSDMPVWVPAAEATLATIDARKAIVRGLKFRPAEDSARDTIAWWNQEPAQRRSGPLKAGITAERENELLAELKKKA